MIIDSHCHLDFPELQADEAGVIARAVAAGVERMVTIGTWVDRFDTIRAIAERNERVWCTVGTHPHNADKELHVETADLVRLAAFEKCIGIGEAGLDYFYDNAPKEAQATGLRRHIAAARETQLPLVIHARSADDDMAAILEEEHGAGGFPFLLHCYTGGMDLARRALALGGYISFSGILTYKSAASVREVAAMVPADRYLVETDAPYLAPVPHRGASNEPSFVVHTAEHLAETRGVSFETVARETTDNFFRLFTKAKR